MCSSGWRQRSLQSRRTVQRCVRAGGKHNDLENVGYTARHHTFFEMLGNFSFGDYFKREAIQYAWEFLTETCGLPAEKLWVTVYQDDDEAADIWLKELGVDPERFSRLRRQGQLLVHGRYRSLRALLPRFSTTTAPRSPGGPPGSPDEDGDRYIEIWNLVFMQYDRDAEGEMTPLPKPSVDTGMGLERLAAVMQGVHTNYEIDLFQHLIRAAAETGGHGRAGKQVPAGDRRPHPFLRFSDRGRRDCPPTKGAAMCCAASFAAPCATATSSVCVNPFSISWWRRWPR